MPIKLKSLKKTKKENIPLPKQGEKIEGKIAAVERNSLFVDLGVKGVGVIYGKEMRKAKTFLKKMEKGDKIIVKITSLENEDGYRELSISDALKESAWKEALEAHQNRDVVEVKVKKANKGGLICALGNLTGFLPASQLSSEHYPKIKNGDLNEIARCLQRFVDKTLRVEILDLDPKKEKLIFTEKGSAEGLDKTSAYNDIAEKYKIGEQVKGEITKLTEFGAFLKLPNGTEALLYPPQKKNKEKMQSFENLKKGDEVEATVIKAEDNKLYLSF